MRYAMALALLVLAACGGGSTDPQPSSSTPHTRAPTLSQIHSDNAPYPLIFARQFTAAEASDYLTDFGLSPLYIRTNECPPEGSCPFTGIPPEESGCLVVQTVVDFTRTPFQSSHTRTAISWSGVSAELSFDQNWAPLPVGVDISCRDEAREAGLNSTPTPSP